MIGETAMTAPRKPKSLTHPRDGEDGLDADERVGRANDHRAQPFVAQGGQKVRMWASIRRAIEGKFPTTGRH